MVGIVVGLALQMAASPQAREEAMVRDARNAQSRFETARRMNLPRAPRDPGHPCHARVGRYCFWSEGEESKPPTEPAAIVRARARLLASLDSALSTNPSNQWLHGQVTRYLLEAGRAAEASERARACGAPRWWCAALEGLALHVSERYGEADSVYDMALDSMPDAKRCEWTDLRLLVTGRIAREIERASCAERESIATRLWTLAKPMWSTPGNDLRTEHFARWTMAEIQAQSAIAHSMRFGDDSHELMVRYGWSEWFTREEPTPGLSTMSGPSITGHGREPSHSFFPRVESVTTWPRVTAESWSFRDTLARSLYAPRHVTKVTALPHQLVRLSRGDSIEIAVAYASSDAVLRKDVLSADISALYGGEIRARASNRVVGARSRGTLRFTVPRDTMIVSIEVRGDSSKRLARARYTVDPLPCSRVCVSDLVLFSGESRSDNAPLDSALSNALTEMRHSVAEPLGVYWELSELSELSDPEPTAQMDVSLMVTPIKMSRTRRMAVALRLARQQSPVALRWQATPRRAESVVLRLPSGARGKYRVVLTIDPSNGPAVTSTREIELVR